MQNWKKEKIILIRKSVLVLHSVQLQSQSHYVPQDSMEETKSAYDHIAASFLKQWCILSGKVK
jgi:hypothetical protein